MTYKEFFQHLQELKKTRGGVHAATEQELDELIALVNQLPCTGEGPTTLQVGKYVRATVRVLNGEQVISGPGCPHCDHLASFKWAKSRHEARRIGRPEPPPPWPVTPE